MLDIENSKCIDANVLQYEEKNIIQQLSTILD